MDNWQLFPEKKFLNIFLQLVLLRRNLMAVGFVLVEKQRVLVSTFIRSYSSQELT